MKKPLANQTDPLVEIPPFDFEHSRPNPFAAAYTTPAETVRLDSDQEKAIILEPDVAPYFPDSASVNTALRALIAAFSQIKEPHLAH